MSGTPKGSRIGWQKRRARSRVWPADISRVERDGEVPPSLQPQLPIAKSEAEELARGLGGANNLSPQQAILVQDFAWLGVIMRGLIWLWIRTEDPEVGGRVATIASARRATLQLLGISEVREEHDALARYRQRPAEERAGAPISVAPAPDLGNGSDRAAGAGGGPGLEGLEDEAGGDGQGEKVIP